MGELRKLLAYIDIENLSKVTRLAFGAAFLLIAYGYLCRWIGIYFFWESLTLGFELLFFTVVLLLAERARSEQLKNKKILTELIFIGVISFILFIQLIVFAFMSRADAYGAAIHFLNTNADIKNKVGNVKSCFLKPSGSLSAESSSEGTSGEADWTFIVKGDKKYMDVHLHVFKTVETEWTVDMWEQD